MSGSDSTYRPTPEMLRAARSIIRKEQRRLQESGAGSSSDAAPSAASGSKAPPKPLLPVDVCRSFLANECDGRCGKTHRVPPEFLNFVAKSLGAAPTGGSSEIMPRTNDVNDPITPVTPMMTTAPPAAVGYQQAERQEIVCAAGLRTSGEDPGPPIWQPQATPYETPSAFGVKPDSASGAGRSKAAPTRDGRRLGPSADDRPFDPLEALAKVAGSATCVFLAETGGSTSTFGSESSCSTVRERVLQQFRDMPHAWTLLPPAACVGLGATAASIRVDLAKSVGSGRAAVLLSPAAPIAVAAGQQHVAAGMAACIAACDFALLALDGLAGLGALLRAVGAGGGGGAGSPKAGEETVGDALAAVAARAVLDAPGCRGTTQVLGTRLYAPSVQLCVAVLPDPSPNAQNNAAALPLDRRAFASCYPAEEWPRAVMEAARLPPWSALQPASEVAAAVVAGSLRRVDPAAGADFGITVCSAAATPNVGWRRQTRSSAEPPAAVHGAEEINDASAIAAAALHALLSSVGSDRTGEQLTAALRASLRLAAALNSTARRC